MATPNAVPRKSALTLAPVPDLHFILYQASQNNIGYWFLGVLDSGEFRIMSGQVPEPDESKRVDSSLAAFAVILELSEGRTGTLNIPHSGLRGNFESIVDALPHLSLSTSGVPTRYPSMVHEQMQEQVPSLQPAPKEKPRHSRDEKPARKLTVSTDASIGATGRVAGIGWVVREDEVTIACGLTTKSVQRCGDILCAEIYAVAHALRALSSGVVGAIPAGSSVTVESDSRGAIAAVKAAADTRETSSRKAVLTAASTVKASFPVQFKWVKGHATDEGNNAADRLAKLARRNAEFNVSEDVRMTLEATAREEILGLSRAA